VTTLKVSDIDGERKTLLVEQGKGRKDLYAMLSPVLLDILQGKGRKDRYAMLSPALLDILHRWWKEGRASGLLLNGGWLFPGQNPVNPISNRQLSRAIIAAATDAKIDKRVTMHLLRHSFATHLLEQKVDIRLIQVLLGHSKLETTSLYAQVATDILQEVTSPLEILPIPT